MFMNKYIIILYDDSLFHPDILEQSVDKEEIQRYHDFVYNSLTELNSQLFQEKNGIRSSILSTE